MKYQEWVEDDGLIRVQGWARDGLTDKQIAKNIGVSEKTLCDWKKRFSQFRKSIKDGKAPVDYEVENALLKRALGFIVTETKTVEELSEDGEYIVVQRVTTEKYIPPDVRSIIFWLKNRRPDKWREKSFVENSIISGEGEADPITRSLREMAELLNQAQERDTE